MTEGHQDSFLSSMFVEIVGTARHDLHESVNRLEEMEEDTERKRQGVAKKFMNQNLTNQS